MRGWVYIITNKAMPNLLKVGFSTKDPKIFRASELNHTNNPHPFEVEYDALVNEPKIAEQKAHRLLDRYLEGKEWFRCKIETAMAAIRVSAEEIFLENYQFEKFPTKEDIEQQRIGEWLVAEQKDDELLEKRERAVSFMQSDKAKFALRKLIKEEPLYTQAYNDLGWFEFEDGEYKKALELYEFAFKNEFPLYENIADSDYVTYSEINCRPFFDALEGLGRCYMRIGNTEKAIEYFELILKYDHDDHLFVSFLLGDLHFKIGNYKKSKEYFTDFSEYIPYKYSLALLYFKENELIKSLTLLRNGFIKNIYIAKLLLGINPITSKEEYNQIIHESGDCKPETADDYAELNSEMWKSVDGAIPFLKSVYNNSIVKSETEMFFIKLTELFNAEELRTFCRQ